MIGFEMDASGSDNFTWHGEAWTEGSLWIAKVAIDKLSKNPVSKASESVVDLIEGEFAKIKNSMFQKVASLGMNLHLTVTGSFNFMYYFQASKSGTQTATELLKILASQSEEMRDQVMIHFCRCILDFQTHVVFSNTSNLKLKVDIAL